MYNRRDPMRTFSMYNVLFIILKIHSLRQKKHMYIFDLHVVNFIFTNKVVI